MSYRAMLLLNEAEAVSSQNAGIVKYSPQKLKAL